MSNRLKRITDLFGEGTTLDLGVDETGTPVLVWVNKLNSFEDEDARRDGLAARAERLVELSDPDNAEMKAAIAQMSTWELDELLDQATQQKFDEDYMRAIDDVEADEEWREKLEYVRRAPELHDDAGLPADDKRRAMYDEFNEGYLNELRIRADKYQADRRSDLAKTSVSELQEQFIEDIKGRLGMLAYMEERRATEIYFAARDCAATRIEDGWSHAECDHRQRLLSSRSEVRELPETVIEKIVEALSNVTVDRKTAGNSEGPTNSSESLVPPKPQEESVPSIPEVTQPVVVGT